MWKSLQKLVNKICTLHFISTCKCSDYLLIFSEDKNSGECVSTFVCFVWFFFGVYLSSREFYTHMETSPLLVKGCKIDLCSALMAIEQWGFFNVPHPLRLWPTVYNGHLWGPVTLTPVAKLYAVELSLPAFKTLVSHDRGLNPNLLHSRGTLYLYTKVKNHQTMLSMDQLQNRLDLWKAY